MSIAVVIANGPNWLEIPVLLFQTKEEAEAHLNGISFLERKVKTKAAFKGDEDEIGLVYWYFPEGSECDPEAEDDDGVHPDLKKLFKDGSYYDGCGGVSSFTIKEFEFGIPMVSWDLD